MKTFSLVHSIAALTLLLVLHITIGKRILIFTPVPSYSHQIVFRALSLALNKRGHEIVIFTSDPIKNSSLSKYTEFDYSHMYKLVSNLNYFLLRRGADGTDYKKEIWNLSSAFTNAVFGHPELKRLYASGCEEKFDAVIVEMIVVPLANILGCRFKAPLIGISSLELNYNHWNLLGAPVTATQNSNVELGSYDANDLTFWGRLYTFVLTWWHFYTWYNIYMDEAYGIVKKHFGDDIPAMSDVANDVQLVLVNQEIALTYPRPELPNVISFSAVHIEEKPQALPKNIKEFLDNATDGFIYVCLGSNVRSEMLPEETLQIFKETLSSLPWKILWKFDDKVEHISDNILALKWVPQQSVLAHPNIKLLVYQGGVQSTEEAVYYSVPIIGIPFVIEQDYRVAKLTSLGVGKRLEILTITRLKFRDTIYEVFNNNSYKENMMKLSALAKDKPYESLDHAVWWVEHVMRHNGASHLRLNEFKKSWYQRYDMDVIAFLGIILFITTILLATLFYNIFLEIFKLYFSAIFQNEDKLKPS